MNYKLFLGLIMVLALMPMAMAQTNLGKEINGSNLWITDANVDVCNPGEGCDDGDVSDGEKISDEVRPGGTVEFDIEVTNMFPDNGSDIELEDLEITITIQDIDDGDEIDMDGELDDLSPDDEDSVKLKFDIPVEVDEDDSIDVLIEIEADSVNGVAQKAEMRLTLEVEKENNEVRFTQMALSPSQVSCQRAVSLDVGVQNTGAEDEDDTILEIMQSDFDLNLRETFDLSEDAFDDDSKFRKNYKFTVGSDAVPGVYPITARVTFNDGRDTETSTVDLTVARCVTTTPPKEEEDETQTPAEEEDEQDDEVVVVRPGTQNPPTTTPPVVVTPPTLPPQTQEKESLFKSNSFLTLLIVGEVLLVIVAIVIIMVAMRRRD